MRFALVEMVARHLGSSSGTHRWAQESWEAARGAGLVAGGRLESGWLWFCPVLRRLGRVLVQLRKCLTFTTPRIAI
jgi:hypothetical protein